MQGVQVKLEHYLHTNVCKIGMVHRKDVSWKYPTFLRALHEWAIKLMFISKDAYIRTYSSFGKNVIPPTKCCCYRTIIWAHTETLRELACLICMHEARSLFYQHWLYCMYTQLIGLRKFSRLRTWVGNYSTMWKFCRRGDASPNNLWKGDEREGRGESQFCPLFVEWSTTGWKINFSLSHHWKTASSLSWWRVSYLWNI